MQLLKALFTPECVLCNMPLEPNCRLCETCIDTLPVPEIPRQYANLLLDPSISELLKQPKFDVLHALFWYQGFIAQWLSALKFRQQIHHIPLLQSLIQQRFKHICMHPCFIPPDLVLVTPLYARRLLWRGFNQVHQTWRPVLKNFEYVPEGLTRTRATKAQVGLSRRERLRNLKGAFACGNVDVAGKVVAVVDDVITTGSTINAISQMLKAQGAKQVQAWCTCIRALDEVS